MEGKTAFIPGGWGTAQSCFFHQLIFYFLLFCTYVVINMPVGEGEEGIRGLKAGLES